MIGDSLQLPKDFDPRSWLREFEQLLRRRHRTQGRVMGLAVVVGVVAGIGAVIFSAACHFSAHYFLEGMAGYEALAPAGEAEVPWIGETETPFRPWMLLLVPTLGGLLSGWIVFRFAPEAEGHGTDAAIASYHYRQGRIRARVPIVKLIASAITIGTGGSGGREGPIAQIGAGFGSQLSDMFHLRPAERRILLAAGIGAGIAAIFRAPLAGALFSAEVLYRSSELEQEVLIPTGIASVVSYCTFGVFFGWEPLFASPDLGFGSPWELGPYLVLAITMALLAMFYVRTLNGITGLFGRLPIPRTLKPAVGGLLTGVVGFALLMVIDDKQVLSVFSAGYDIIQNGLDDPDALLIPVLLAVAFGKIFTTSLTIGSGGSGGVFGPSMVIGGSAGAALGIMFHRLMPTVVTHPTSFMIVGMAGFFAAAAKTPFSTLAIVCEMTGDYGLLLPALWVCNISFLLSDEQSLYGWQVENRSRSPAHQGAFLREILGDLRVADFLDPNVDVSPLRPENSLPDIVERFETSDHHVLPVVGEDMRLLGVISLDELVRHDLHHRELTSLLLVADAMQTGIHPILPSDTLGHALELFAENDLPALPVVADTQSMRVIGMVRRSEVVTAYLRRLHGPASDDISQKVLAQETWE